MNLLDVQQTLTSEKYREFFFKKEADPLFNKWQRGEATKEQWLAKVNEIRQRFPYSDNCSVEEGNLFMKELVGLGS